MATEAARRRARHSIERLARSSLEAEDFRWEATEVLRVAIGFDWSCWVLTDPGAHLPTRFMADNPIISRAQRRFYQLLEHANWEVWSGASPAIMTMSAATGGDLSSNVVWRELLGPGGGGDSLQASLRVDGTCWGFLDLGREGSHRWLDAEEMAFMAEVAPTLASRERDGLRSPSEREDELDEPGTIVLDRYLSLVAATEAA